MWTKYKEFVHTPLLHKITRVQKHDVDRINDLKTDTGKIIRNKFLLSNLCGTFDIQTVVLSHFPWLCLLLQKKYVHICMYAHVYIYICA